MNKIAIIFGKITQRLLRLLGKGGGTLPGIVALKIDKNFLKKLSYPKDIILVTGTNGKSTVTNLLCEILENSGKRVICNRAGNNLKMGAVAILLENASLFGRVKGDVVLLEVDELSIPRIMEDITPTVIVVNNFFRDQLDRAGEMENVIRRIESCLPDYSGKLVLNGNDPSVARLALCAKKAHVTYFGFDSYENSVHETTEASEGRFCPICSSELKYDYYQYSHIGRFSCEKDEFGKYSIDYLGKVVSISDGRYEVNGEVYKSTSRALFGFYNEVATIAVSTMLGVNNDCIKKTVASYKMNNGRMESYSLKNGHTCLLNLAKNPAGQNESMKVVADYDGDCVVALILNDMDGDGEDTSWIYDAKMELLCKENIKRIYTGGMRSLEMALRMQYADFKGEIIPLDKLEDLADVLNKEDVDSFVIANYTSLQPTRKILKGGSL